MRENQRKNRRFGIHPLLQARYVDAFYSPFEKLIQHEDFFFLILLLLSSTSTSFRPSSIRHYGSFYVCLCLFKTSIFLLKFKIN